MKKIKMMEIAVIFNMLMMTLNIMMAFRNLYFGNTWVMVLNIGCAICSGITAVICAVFAK